MANPDSLLLDGADDRVRVTAGNFAGSGAVSFAIIVKFVEAFSSYQWIVTRNGDAANGGVLGVTGGGVLLTYNGADRTGPTIPATGEWYLLGVSKASGTVTPRLHVYRYSNTTWTHQDASGTQANWSAFTDIGFGESPAEFFGGDILIAGGWDSELADADFEALISAHSAWHTKAPDEAWRFNTVAPLQSFMSGGASVETTARVGVTLDAGDFPTGWSDDATAPAFIGAGALAVATSGTTITPALPAGTQADDYAVCMLMTNAGDTFLDESGWDTLGSDIDNNANMSASFKGKRLVGGDSNPTFDITANTALGTSNGLYARIYVWRGVDTGSTPPIELAGNNGSPTSSTTPAGNLADTTGPYRTLITMALIDDDPDFSSGNPPSGWVEPIAGASSTTGGDARVDVIQKYVASATSGITGATVGTLPAADFWRTITFALIPVTVVAAPGPTRVYVPSRSMRALLRR